MRKISAAVIIVLLATPALAQGTQPMAVVSSTNPDGSYNICAVGTAGCTVPIGGGSSGVNPVGASSTDIGGSVTAGGTYQTVAAASSARKNCTIQNPSTATEALNVKFGTQGNPYVIDPGGSISALNGVVVATDAITVTAATTGHSFSGTCQ